MLRRYLPEVVCKFVECRSSGGVYLPTDRFTIFHRMDVVKTQIKSKLAKLDMQENINGKTYHSFYFSWIPQKY